MYFQWNKLPFKTKKCLQQIALNVIDQSLFDNTFFQVIMVIVIIVVIVV